MWLLRLGSRMLLLRWRLWVRMLLRLLLLLLLLLRWGCRWLGSKRGPIVA